MIAITSLLDEKGSELVADITERLENRFGLQGVKITPYPHITLAVAEVPDLEELKQYLEHTCMSLQPFHIRTTGLGIFPGSNPVVYIPALRTNALNELHGRLHRDISEMSSEMAIYYSHTHWMPHITLALGDTTNDLLGPVLTYLSQFNFNWDINLDNITLLQKCGDYYLKDEEFHFGSRELTY